MAKAINISEVKAGDTIELHGFRHDGETYLVNRVEHDTATHFSLGRLPYYRLYALCGLKLPPEKRKERQVLSSFGAVDGVQVRLVSRS